MNKDEILAKSKKIGFDEGEEKIEADAFNYWLVTVMALVTSFGVWKLFYRIRSYEIISILMGYTANTSFYKYKKSKSRRFFVSGIMGSIVSIASFIAFCLGV